MSYRVDRCANQSCRTTIDLDWDAVACPCGAVVTCVGCDEIEACDTCRSALEHDSERLPNGLTHEQDAAFQRLAEAIVEHGEGA